MADVPADVHFRYSHFTTNPTNISAVNGSSTASAALAPGLWLITSSADVFIKQGASDVAASTSTIPLWSKTYFGPIFVTGSADAYVAARTASGSATVYLIPVKNS
jgi:hypothetical protein